MQMVHHEPSKAIADPKALLLGYLDYYRAALLAKLDGLSEDDLRASRLPSGWSPLELFNHLIHMERRWLSGVSPAARWRGRGPTTSTMIPRPTAGFFPLVPRSRV